MCADPEDTSPQYTDSFGGHMIHYLPEAIERIKRAVADFNWTLPTPSPWRNYLLKPKAVLLGMKTFAQRILGNEKFVTLDPEEWKKLVLTFRDKILMPFREFLLDKGDSKKERNELMTVLEQFTKFNETYFVPHNKRCYIETKVVDLMENRIFLGEGKSIDRSTFEAKQSLIPQGKYEFPTFSPTDRDWETK